MNEACKTYTNPTGTLRIAFYPDSDVANPRNDDETPSILVAQHRRYSFSDRDQDCYDEAFRLVAKILREDYNVEIDEDSIDCPCCGGSGVQPGGTPYEDDCEECGGHGTIDNPDYLYRYEEDAQELMAKVDQYDTNKRIAYLPVYLYDHSGQTISTSPFSCRWDSGQLGYIILDTKEDYFGRTDMDFDAAVAVLEGEIKTLNYYVAGEAYGLAREVYDAETEEWDTEDSCWGFFIESTVAPLKDAEGKPTDLGCALADFTTSEEYAAIEAGEWTSD